MGDRVRGGRWRERERERKEASDFSSVTVAFHLTASPPPCLHKNPEDVSLSIWAFVSVWMYMYVLFIGPFPFILLFLPEICTIYLTVIMFVHVCSCARMWLDEGYRDSHSSH